MNASYDIARQQMLRQQLRRRGIHDPRVLAAMARVPRERFVPQDAQAEAYADRALGIECGQTISQPFIVALMTEALELSGRETVLEIGTGSGYQTAILAELCPAVVSLERHAELSHRAAATLAELGYRNVTLLTGDGTLGHPPQAPYSRIIVTAAAAQAPPSLLDQLADGGILVIPLGGPKYQVLQAIRKVGDLLEPTELSGCRFVPLIGDQGPSGEDSLPDQ